ncbi:MAG TPA: hypothetical protein VMS17_31225 [Gemmataceae bacterium]|nr:hypothetical protein [Gemmataceae bacterium]
MVQTAKPAAQASKPSAGTTSTTGTPAVADVAARSRRRRFLSHVVMFFAGVLTLAIGTVAANVITNWINPPLTDQEKDQQRQAADALWGRYVELSGEVRQWRDADVQDYRQATGRLVQVSDLSIDRVARMKAAHALSEVLDLHEANEHDRLTFTDDLLASTKQAIPKLRGLADKVTRLATDADGLHATTEYAKNKQALVKTDAVQLRSEVINGLKNEADFLTTLQAACKVNANALKQDPVVNMPLAEARIEDKERVEHYRDQCSRLQDGWSSASGQAQELADLIFPYVVEWQNQKAK